MLDQHHLDQYDRVGTRPAIVMAVIRLQFLVQPVVVHDLLNFSQQMGLWHQHIDVYYHCLFPRVFFPFLHKTTPVPFIIQEMGDIAPVF